MKENDIEFDEEDLKDDDKEIPRSYGKVDTIILITDARLTVLEKRSQMFCVGKNCENMKFN